MAEQLFPRHPKRKKQPRADQLREQLALAADEIIRLRTERGWIRYYQAVWRQITRRKA